jgi:DnaJ-domain-containing protein 1
MVEKLNSPLLDKLAAQREPRERFCEWPECTEVGEHRAPRSRDEMNSYRWFCREHAREYNKRWNYFDGMSDDEVEADRRADTVWRRPSWPLGDGVPTQDHARAFWRGEFTDPFGFFDQGGEAHGAGPEASRDADTAHLSAEVRKALQVFDLKPPLDQAAVKARYKELVKLHHPDATRSSADEDRIKDINEAYRVISAFLAT